MSQDEENLPVMVITDEMVIAGIKVMLWALEDEEASDEQLVASIFMAMMATYAEGQILFSDGSNHRLRFVGFPTEH